MRTFIGFPGCRRRNNVYCHVCACVCYLAVAPVLVAPHAVAVVQSDRAALRDAIETQLPGVQRIPGPDVLPPAKGEDLKREPENTHLTTR